MFQPRSINLKSTRINIRQRRFREFTNSVLPTASTLTSFHSASLVITYTQSLVELAKARREREAIEESEESDSDSTSSSSTSEAANGCHDVGGRIATRGVMRVSNSRSVLPVSPTVVKFRSPAESLSDSTPALRTRKSEYGGRDSEGKKIKGPVRTSTFVISRSAISLTPRVTFKTLTVTEGAPFAPSPLVSDKTPERDFGRRRPQGRIGHGAGKDETRTAGGRHGLSGGDSPLGPVKGSPRVSACPAAAEPTAEVSAAVATAVVASTGDNSPGSTKGALDTVATVAPKLANCRSGPSSTVFRTNDTRRTSAAGYLVSRDSPKKSTVSTLQEGRTSDTPKKTSSTPDMRLTAVQGIARVDRATIGSLLREAKAPQSAGEESPPATLHPYAAHYSENKRESQSQEVKPPEVCRSDQDAVGSGAKPTKGKVSTPRVMDEGGTPQDTMVRARKMRYSFLTWCSGRGGFPSKHTRGIEASRGRKISRLERLRKHLKTFALTAAVFWCQRAVQ